MVFWLPDQSAIVVFSAAIEGVSGGSSGGPLDGASERHFLRVMVPIRGSIVTVATTYAIITLSLSTSSMRQLADG